MAFSWLRRWFHGSGAPMVPAPPTASGSEGAEAQFLRGVKFANADGVAQDYAQAAEWFARAAEQNHALAQYCLANLCELGRGVTRDEAKALTWLTRAAKLGHAGAQYKLGVQQHVTCRTGGTNGTAERRIEAFKWVRLAAAQGYHGAQTACEFVALGMTQEEVAEAERRAADFVAKK
jgi:TPR repeat protein